MIPKVEAAAHALEEGVRRVVIGRFSAPGDLARLLTGAAGTTILLPPSQAVQEERPIQEERQCNDMAH